MAPISLLALLACPSCSPANGMAISIYRTDQPSSSLSLSNVFVFFFVFAVFFFKIKKGEMMMRRRGVAAVRQMMVAARQMSSVPANIELSTPPEKEKLIVFDTSLRDGEQSPGVTLGLEQK